MKPIYQYFFRGLITFLPLALTVYVLFLFVTWTEGVAMSMIRPVIGDFYLPGLGIVLVSVIAYFLHKQSLSVYQIMGLMFIVLGVVLVNFKS